MNEKLINREAQEAMVKQLRLAAAVLGTAWGTLGIVISLADAARDAVSQAQATINGLANKIDADIPF